MKNSTWRILDFKNVCSRYLDIAVRPPPRAHSAHQSRFRPRQIFLLALLLGCEAREATRTITDTRTLQDRSLSRSICYLLLSANEETILSIMMQSPPTMEVGQTVNIQSRTFPGSNKQGGVAIITAIQRDQSNVPTKIDVRYVLGGKESGVEMTYVETVEEELDGNKRRAARERKQDVKMNIGELPKKKRVALKDIDGNRAKKQKKDDKKKINEKELPIGCEMDGEWMFIKVRNK